MFKVGKRECVCLGCLARCCCDGNSNTCSAVFRIVEYTEDTNFTGTLDGVKSTDAAQDEAK